jgi:serine/threonine-protein kinase
MGEVWLAWDGSLQRNVALKLLRTNGRATAESVRRFEREARLAASSKSTHDSCLRFRRKR